MARLMLSEWESSSPVQRVPPQIKASHQTPKTESSGEDGRRDLHQGVGPGPAEIRAGRPLGVITAGREVREKS